MKIRVKTGQMPGDVSKKEKIAMLEGRSTRVTKKGIRKWKKYKIRDRERAVFKEQTRTEIKRQT